jgi:hypothetical protein
MVSSTPLEIKLHAALRRIASYATPDHMRRTSQRDWGLDPEEAIEMAYETVIGEAKRAIRGVRIRRTANHAFKKAE